jgi:transcriptional regulator with XRE-family HTH domain
MEILDTIRRAIEESGKTRYRIAKDLHWNESHLSKFMRGEAGLSVERMMALVEYLGMELIIRPKKGRVTRGKHRK